MVSGIFNDPGDFLILQGMSNLGDAFLVTYLRVTYFAGLQQCRLHRSGAAAAFHAINFVNFRSYHFMNNTLSRRQVPGLTGEHDNNN